MPAAHCRERKKGPDRTATLLGRAEWFLFFFLYVLV